MYTTICEIDRQSSFDAWDRVLRAGALGWPGGMGWGGIWEGGSGWGTHVHPWLIHVNVWQKPLQYCKVISLQLKKYIKKKHMLQSIIILLLFLPWPTGLIKEESKIHSIKLAGLPAPLFFPNIVCWLGVSVSYFDNWHNYSSFFIIIISWWPVVSGLWC